MTSTVLFFSFLTFVFRSKHWKVHIAAGYDVFLTAQPKEPILLTSIHNECWRTVHRKTEGFHIANHTPINPPEEMLGRGCLSLPKEQALSRAFSTFLLKAGKILQKGDYNTLSIFLIHALEKSNNSKLWLKSLQVLCQQTWCWNDWLWPCSNTGHLLEPTA